MTITMYGADWCGDCRRAKAWFEANDIAYDYVDLVNDPDETERVLERNDGVKKIPVIVFPDDSHLVEPSNDQLASHVATLRQSGVSIPVVPAGDDDVEPVAVDAASDAPVADEAPAVVENVHLGRFELLRNGDVVSFADYRGDDTSIIVPHVETAPEHRGNGYAAELMEGLLGILRSTGRTITPLCPFAARHIRDNEQHHDLLTR